jgi:hypothetical protein
MVGCAFKNKCWFSGFQLETSTPLPLQIVIIMAPVQFGVAHYYSLLLLTLKHSSLIHYYPPLFWHVLQKSFQAPVVVVVVVVLLLLFVSLQLTG